MLVSVGAFSRRLVGAFGVLACSASVFVGTAAAQTTIVLNQTGSEVTDTTLRSGAYSNTNYDTVPLVTRRSTSDPDWERRALLKFDTENNVPAGAQIVSAKLTLTVRSGLGSSGQSRTLDAYRVVGPYLEQDATWLTRMNSQKWTTPGGDLGSKVASASASNVAGAKVTFDVTDLVQQSVDGAYDTRYTRVLLRDAGSEAKESLREFYNSEDSTASRRPTLTITIGSSASSPVTSTSGSTLKVLHWNIAQGNYGGDNIPRVADFIASKRPDIISFNEINKSSSNNQPQRIADLLKAKTGQNWTYKWVQKWGATSGEGECVMTRLTIDDTEQYLLTVDRSVAMIRVNVNGRNISAYSTHLDHQSSSTRLTQVRQLVSWADNYPEQRIVAGDFNSWPGTSEITEMGKTYNDAWAIAVGKNVDVSYSGNPDGNTRNTRIDYVWYSKGATALSVSRAEVYHTKDSISDHNAIMMTFSVK